MIIHDYDDRVPQEYLQKMSSIHILSAKLTSLLQIEYLWVTT